MGLTLGQSRPILWQYVSNVPYEQAGDSDIAYFDSVLNRLCERLLIEGKWRSTFRRVTLQTFGNTLTLPRNLSTCLGCDPVSTDTFCTGFPINIYSRWFEFAASGPGLTSDSARACCIRGLVPVSDTAQTFADPPVSSSGPVTSPDSPFIPPPMPPVYPGFYLRAKSTKASGRGMTLVGGLDENGDMIEGEVKLEIANGTTTTTQVYTKMPFIEKAVTAASVQFYSVDTVSAEETLLCVYAPSETVPEYKRYVIPSAEDGDTFACLCKLKFVPAINDSDLIIPSVVDALILGLMSFRFRDKNDAERSALYMGPNYPGRGDSTAKPVMAGAIDVLDSDRAEDDSAEIPILNFSTSFGAGNIYQVR